MQAWNFSTCYIKSQRYVLFEVLSSILILCTKKTVNLLLDIKFHRNSSKCGSADIYGKFLHWNWEIALVHYSRFLLIINCMRVTNYQHQLY